MHQLIGRILFVKMSTSSHNSPCKCCVQTASPVLMEEGGIGEGPERVVVPARTAQHGTPAPSCVTTHWLFTFCILRFQPQDLLANILRETSVTHRCQTGSTFSSSTLCLGQFHFCLENIITLNGEEMIISIRTSNSIYTEIIIIRRLRPEANIRII